MKGLNWIKFHWILSTVIVLVGLPTIALIRFLTVEPAPEYVTAVARSGELLQTVEAVGTIISEKDLELKFPVSGIVSEVLVDEGDAVVAGQELAKLRSGSLGAAVTAAQARLTTASAELRALQEGTRPEDIAIAEAELRNKQASLDLARSKYETAQNNLLKAEAKLTSLRKEAETSLAGEVSAAGSAATKEISVAETAIRVLEGVFKEVTLENILVQQQPLEYAVIVRSRGAALAKIDALRGSASPKDYREALALLQSARVAVAEAFDVVQLSYDFIARQEPLGLFSSSVRESLKTSIATQKTNTQTALTNVDAALQSLQDKSADYETQIAAEESTVSSSRGTRDQAQADINTFVTAVQISQAQLDLKRAGSRPTDIAAAVGRVQQASADLQKARADFDDTILRAPIDGTITKVNLKAGEFTPGQFSETDAAMTILGISPYRVELFVSEIDIPKVRISQSGSILLDAFPGRPFVLRVSEIDPAATTVDGVPKYRLLLDFSEPDESFKIGMTGDVDVVTDRRENTVYVPARAIIKNEDGNDVVRVMEKDGSVEERRVTTGMETINDIEILAGVEDGDEVVVLVKQ